MSEPVRIVLGVTPVPIQADILIVPEEGMEKQYRIKNALVIKIKEKRVTSVRRIDELNGINP